MVAGIIFRLAFAILFTVFAYRRGWWDYVLPNKLKRHKKHG